MPCSHISMMAYHGEKNPHRNTTYTWPTQPKPPPSDWKNWQHIILTTWTNERRELYTLLGPWIRKTHLQSKWSFHHNSDTLYKYVIHNTYSKHIWRDLRTWQSNHFTSIQNNVCLLSDSIPVLVNTLHQHTPEIEQTIQIQPNPSNPRQHIIDFLQNTSFPANGYHIAQSICNKHAIADCVALYWHAQKTTMIGLRARVV